MTYSQMPNGSLVALQMPLFSVVGGNGEIIVPPDPGPVIDTNLGAVSVLGRFEETFDEQGDEKPEWKERSYRELKETMEILTIVGFFD